MRKPSPPNPQGVALTSLALVAKCTEKATPWRPWCFVVDFPQGSAKELPKKSLVGMTVELETGKDVKDALSNKVTFVALAIDSDGKVKLTDVKPTSDAERKTVGEAVAAVTLVFKGKAKTAKLPKELSSFVKTLEGKYETKATRGSIIWTGANPSELHKVGDFYAVIFSPGSRRASLIPRYLDLPPGGEAPLALAVGAIAGQAWASSSRGSRDGSRSTRF